MSLSFSVCRKNGIGAGIQASNHKVLSDRAGFGSVLGEGSRECGTGS